MEFQLDQLFSSFGVQETYDILAITLIAFILGFLVAWFARTSRVIKLRRELKEKKKALEEAKNELTQANEKMTLQEADLRRASLEIEELENKASRIENEKNGLYNEVYALNGELEKLQAANKTYVSTIDDLNSQIQLLRSQNDLLVEQSNNTPPPPPPPAADPQVGVEDLAEIRSIYNATRNRLEAVESTISRLENENQNLKEEVRGLKEQTNEPGLIFATPAPTLQAEAEPDKAEEEPIPDLTFVADKNIFGEKIAVDHPEQDDLTLINGVGPFLEKKLNEIGVYSYEQISNWDQARVEQVTTQIGFFKGRIEKDDWVGQAYKLHQLKLKDPDSLQKQKAGSEVLTDLKIVEGIGPKIEQILKNAGIATLDQLAQTESARLKEILEEAGDRYRIHDPGTWPAQARLAVNGEWELLKEYQDELKGGREVNS